ncbi:MAG: 50S ribosomal protein L21 [Deltaproteobacteria bacterium]|jgi:large subunit ribosomal protein L21|nr:50S ribosomal protein L21 [Deltaproteobacteria bacterium]
MYAIVESGCRQLRVEEGKKIRVDLLAAKAGDEVLLDKVLFLGGKDARIGDPYVEGASVSAEVLEHVQDKKIIVFKKWRRNDSFRANGHRQKYTTLKIKAITAEAEGHGA